MSTAGPPRAPPGALNYVAAVVDEIALEGLDGITIEALVKRYLARSKRNEECDEAERRRLEQLLWDVVRNQPAVQVKLLAEDRGRLVLSGYGDDEAASVGVEIYPFELVGEDGVMGSCSTFRTRNEVTKKAKAVLDVSALKSKYPELRLVFVASQEQRARALLGPEHDPNAPQAILLGLSLVVKLILIWNLKTL